MLFFAIHKSTVHSVSFSKLSLEAIEICWWNSCGPPDVIQASAPSAPHSWDHCCSASPCGHWPISLPSTLPFHPPLAPLSHYNTLSIIAHSRLMAFLRDLLQHGGNWEKRGKFCTWLHVHEMWKIWMMNHGQWLSNVWMRFWIHINYIYYDRSVILNSIELQITKLLGLIMAVVVQEYHPSMFFGVLGYEFLTGYQNTHNRDNLKMMVQWCHIKLECFHLRQTKSIVLNRFFLLYKHLMQYHKLS